MDIESELKVDLDKYSSATAIVEATFTQILPKISVGVSVANICDYGDRLIEAYAKAVPRKDKKIEKGIGFPTCVTVNNLLAYHSPSSDDSYVLKDGDLVKIELGAQIDGYYSSSARTVVVGSVSETQANVINAAYYALEAAIRLMRPGQKNTQVTQTIETVANKFGVNPVHGTLSSQINRFTVNGQKVIPNKTDNENKAEEVTFEADEAYTINILMSTGTGKVKESIHKPNVFQRDPNVEYQLKLKSSRNLLKNVNQKFSVFPFSMRFFTDSKIKAGLGECLKHGLITSYPIYTEKNGEFISQFKATIIIRETDTFRLTQPIEPTVPSTQSLSEDPTLKILLSKELTVAKLDLPSPLNLDFKGNAMDMS